MRVWLVIVAVLAVAAHAFAATTVSSQASTATVAIFAPSGMPLRLTAGPDGATVIGANATSAQSTVTGGTLAAVAHETATVTNQLSSAQRIRMTLVSATGTGLSECVECTLQLRNGATQSTQLSYVNGAASSTQGAWVAVDASGGSAAAWTLHTVTRASIVAEKSAVLDYQLEMVPSGSTSPALVLYNMRVTFTV